LPALELLSLPAAFFRQPFDVLADFLHLVMQPTNFLP
jgi:hypothetical protein